MKEIKKLNLTIQDLQGYGYSYGKEYFELPDEINRATKIALVEIQKKLNEIIEALSSLQDSSKEANELGVLDDEKL